MVVTRRSAFALIATLFSVACSPAADPSARYTVVVVGYDAEWKIRGIKAIREITGLGLADAKQLIESPHGIVKTALPQADAEAIASHLRARRITVEVRRQ